MIGRVIVTGARGFLGSHLTAALERAGWDVLALDRTVDVTDREAVLRAAHPATAVVHLAFPTSRDARRSAPARTLGDVAEGIRNVAELTMTAGASHLLLASSGKVYGRPRELPTGEGAPVAPTTFLGELKAVEEHAAAAMARATRAFALTALRIFNVYGPGQPVSFFVPHLIAGLRSEQPLVLGELDHARDWIHARDVARAFVTALETNPSGGAVRTLNVGSGQSRSVRELLALAGEIAGKLPPIREEPTRLRPDEAPEERADIAQISTLGWAPKIPLSEGLAELLTD